MTATYRISQDFETIDLDLTETDIVERYGIFNVRAFRADIADYGEFWVGEHCIEPQKAKKRQAA